MKYFNNILLFLILISIPNTDDKITVTIQATSGIIDKVKYSKSKILTFSISCSVNQNITNKISLVDLITNIKNPEDNKIFPASCNIQPVRLKKDEEFVDTKLNCKMNYLDYSNDEVDDDMNLIIDGTFSYTSDVVDFVFESFDKIGIPIEIGGLFIYNLEKDSCLDSTFKFEMNFTNDYTPPLESTICKISLSNNEIHSIANCAIPVSSNMILCYIDVSKSKIDKGEEIEIQSQTLVKCKNGHIVTIIDDAQNILEIEEDCEKNFFLFYSIINILFLCLIIF